MLRGGQPVAHDPFELIGRHARVRRHDDFHQRFFAARQRGFHVALEERGERLLVLPFGMLRRERLHAIEREGELEIDRLLGPQRAVVVEHRDARGRRYEILAAFRGDARDEVQDGLFGRAVVPGWQSIGREHRQRECDEHERDQSFHVCVGLVFITEYGQNTREKNAGLLDFGPIRASRNIRGTKP